MRKPLEDMSEDEARTWVHELRGRLQLKQAREHNYLDYRVYCAEHGIYIPTDPLAETPEASHGYIEVALAGEKIALVDAELAPEITQKRWHARKSGPTYYACREEWPGGVRTLRRMHIIFYERVHGPVPAGVEIDHKNGNGLDNRMENLRAVTHGVNVQNNKRRREGTTVSRYLGVTFHSQSRKWCARLRVQGKCHSLGYFDSEETAGMAYVQALVACGQTNPGHTPAYQQDEAYEADQDLENDLLAILEYLEK